MTAQVSDIFDIRYGHSLELNALAQTTPEKGVAFVSRKAGDNGISAYVEPIDDIEPGVAGEITCALSGNGVLTTCLQETPFYTGYHVAILTPKLVMSKAETLFYCLCIKSNRYRYSYGRQANKTLAELIVPSPKDVPSWVQKVSMDPFAEADAPLADHEIQLPSPAQWKEFSYSSLFDIKKGQRLTKEKMTTGATPFIGAIDSNNGYRQFVSASPNHQSNTITVTYNGSVAEAFFQPAPYWASDDVNVLYPKFDMSLYVAMFLCTLIRQEKFRFNYGRKWHLGRMKESIIKLPTGPDGRPDWELMESYVKTLPYSVSL